VREMAHHWPFFRALLSNMDMVLAKSDIAIASRYADLVRDKALRESIFPRVRREWEASIRTLLEITGQTLLLEGNPSLARSIRNRFPYLDPLNHCKSSCLNGIAKVTPMIVLSRASISPLTGSLPAYATAANLMLRLSSAR